MPPLNRRDRRAGGRRACEIASKSDCSVAARRRLASSGMSPAATMRCVVANEAALNDAHIGDDVARHDFARTAVRAPPPRSPRCRFDGKTAIAEKGAFAIMLTHQIRGETDFAGAAAGVTFASQRLENRRCDRTSCAHEFDFARRLDGDAGSAGHLEESGYGEKQAFHAGQDGLVK